MRSASLHGIWHCGFHIDAGLSKHGMPPEPGGIVPKWSKHARVYLMFSGYFLLFPRHTPVLFLFYCFLPPENWSASTRHDSTKWNFFSAQVYASAAVAEHRATRSFKPAPVGTTFERGALLGGRNIFSFERSWQCSWRVPSHSLSFLFFFWGGPSRHGPFRRSQSKAKPFQPNREELMILSTFNAPW